MLYVQVRARMQTPDSTRPSVVRRDDLDLLRHCEATRRRAWEVALDYYEVHFASLDLVFDASLIATTNRIAALESHPSLEASGLDPALVQVLEAARRLIGRCGGHSTTPRIGRGLTR